MQNIYSKASLMCWKLYGAFSGDACNNGIGVVFELYANYWLRSNILHIVAGNNSTHHNYETERASSVLATYHLITAVRKTDRSQPIICNVYLHICVLLLDSSSHGSSFDGCRGILTALWQYGWLKSINL